MKGLDLDQRHQRNQIQGTVKGMMLMMGRFGLGCLGLVLLPWLRAALFCGVLMPYGYDEEIGCMLHG